MEEIHIGALIGKKLHEKRMLRGELSDLIGLKRNSTSEIIYKEDIYCSKLLKISVAMGYDFFSHYVAQLPAEIQQSAATQALTRDAARINELEKQLADCQKENSFLKKINELLEKKG